MFHTIEVGILSLALAYGQISENGVCTMVQNIKYLGIHNYNIQEWY